MYSANVDINTKDLSMGFITGSNIRVLLSASALALFASLTVAHASTFKVLYAFNGENDGCYPFGGMILDGAGNIYGTTGEGACFASVFGSVFKLAPDGTESVLYAFEEGSGGFEPDGLVLDRQGNLWGTTGAGGIGGGVIFEINTRDKEKLIHTFEGGPNDGCAPEGAMVVDLSGDFHGTTLSCGKHDYGTVFTVAPDGSESLFYSFKGGRDGFYPTAGLTIDAQEDFYGTTDSGGKIGACTPENFNGCGTIFKLTPNGTKALLYRFKGPPNDGELPQGNLTMDTAGSLYGVTIRGGVAGCVGDEGCGVVFKLAPDGSETVLHFFAGGRGDGANPAAGLIADAAGTLFGTTLYGGGGSSCNGTIGCGTVFEIAPDGTETILHKFKEPTDGANPAGGLVADAAGNLYGTAQNGGQYGYGTVFEITP